MVGLQISRGEGESILDIKLAQSRKIGLIVCREFCGGGGGDDGKNVLDVGSPVKGFDVGGEGLGVGVEYPINQIIRDDPGKRTVYLLSWDVTSTDSSPSCETSPSSKNDDFLGDFPRRRF